MKKIATLSSVLALTLAALAQPVPQPTPQPAAQPVVQPAAQLGKDEAETIVIPAGHTMQGIPVETLLDTTSTLVLEEFHSVII